MDHGLASKSITVVEYAVVYFFIYEEPRCPPWIYDVVKAITMFIVFVNIVVIPALALPGH
ncbi:hypothetical protein AMK80_15315 [Escherichia coli]|nr:hypothetical protein AML06_25460 [Escherichia coli]KYT00399.1 hypothetical protein AML41_12195 [Escherichia coli]KYV54204.1 hypothetical protein AMK80_15315 [Escherichia coli]KYV73409.1 hypothetical protein AMK84_17105 [Escherichia coli]KYW58845.1 hypothetical protein AML84_17930 [Escherichia coli]